MIASMRRSRGPTKSFSAVLVAASVFVTASAVVVLTSGQDQEFLSARSWGLRGTVIPRALSGSPPLGQIVAPAHRTIAANDPFVGDGKAEQDR